MLDLENILINDMDSLHKAIEVIDKGAAQFALVVNESRVLLGIVTDGDVRRGLLRGVTLADPVSYVMHKDFRYISEPSDRSEAINLMAMEGLMQLPILDSTGRVIDLICRNAGAEGESFENVVVLMAGGEGKRLLPLTERVPKPMIQVGGKPMLERILDRCAKHGFQKFYISVNYRKEQIEEYFGNGSKWNVEIEYLKEERPLGTAGSLAQLPENPVKPIVVVNGDVLSDVDLPSLLRFHNEHDAVATIGVRVHEVQIPFGVVEIDGVRMKSLIEKPVLPHFVSAGVYVLSPRLLETIPRGEKIDMPDFLNSASLKGSRIIVFPIHEYWLDAGTHNSLAQANVDER